MVYFCVHCEYRFEIGLKKKDAKLNIEFLSNLNHYELCPKCSQRMSKIK